VSLNSGDNALEVEIHSRKGSFLTISFCAPVEDVTPPALEITQPIDGSSLSEAQPNLALTYPDLPAAPGSVVSGTATETLVVTLDGVDVTSALTVRDEDAAGLVPEPLSEGAHQLEAEISDEAGTRPRSVPSSSSMQRRRV
jgi:hypothetical protein